MFNKIRKLFGRKKEIVKKQVIKPVVDSQFILDKHFDNTGLLVMNDDESLNDFVFYCDIAMKTKTFFDRVIVPQSTYRNIHAELVMSNSLTTFDGKKNVIKKPFTENGKQSLFGLTDPFAKRDVKVYTIKPRDFLTIN